MNIFDQLVHVRRIAILAGLINEHERASISVNDGQSFVTDIKGKCVAAVGSFLADDDDAEKAIEKLTRIIAKQARGVSDSMLRKHEKNLRDARELKERLDAIVKDIPDPPTPAIPPPPDPPSDPDPNHFGP